MSNPPKNAGRPYVQRYRNCSPDRPVQSSLAIVVPNRVANSHRKTNPPRLAPYETDTVAVKEHD